MPTIDLKHIPVPRLGSSIKQVIIDALVQRFGAGPRNPSNIFHQIADAFMLLPVDRLEQELLLLYSEFDPRSNHGVNLESSLWPLFERIQAELSSGYVELSYKAPMPTSPFPLFAASTIDFIDAAGKHYRLNADMQPPGELFDGGTSGTFSETIGGATVRIAQRIPVATADDNSFVQAVRFVPTTVSSTPAVTVRIETDSAGSPSGVLADARLEVTGFATTSGIENEAVFTLGARLPTADYWAVIILTAGTLKFDGGAGGVATNQVKTYNGAWALSALVENLNLQLVFGGVAPVTAVELGTLGNIVADSIVGARFSDNATQTLYGTIVNSEENLLAFTGGLDTETDAELRLRAQTSRSAREVTSLDGIVTALRDSTAGVTSATGEENTTPTWSNEDLIQNFAGGVTASETINGTNTRYAQKFTVGDDGSVAQVVYSLFANAGLTLTVEVEGDSAGSPSGTATYPRLQKVGVAPVGTGSQTISFDGDFLPAGDYWMVFIRTAGTGSFNGTTSGTQLAKYYDGTWHNSTNKQVTMRVLGGLPPHSFRVWTRGGTATDIGNTIHAKRPAGIYAYGTETVTVEDAFGNDVDERYNIATAIPVVVYITAEVDSTFIGDEDTIRDLVVNYIGGLDTSGVDQPGIGISKKLIYDYLRASITPRATTAATGVDPSNVYVGIKSVFAVPGSLTSTEVADLAGQQGYYYTISNPETDIEVILTVV